VTKYENAQNTMGNLHIKHRSTQKNEKISRNHVHHQKEETRIPGTGYEI